MLFSFARKWTGYVTRNTSLLNVCLLLTYFWSTTASPNFRGCCCNFTFVHFTIQYFSHKWRHCVSVIQTNFCERYTLSVSLVYQFRQNHTRQIKYFKTHRSSVNSESKLRPLWATRLYIGTKLSFALIRYTEYACKHPIKSFSSDTLLLRLVFN